MRRAVAAAVVAIVALPLGALQVASAIVLRGSARAGAWPTFVPPALAARVDRLDPALPMPPALRLVLARGAFARGDLALAARDARTLGPSRDGLALAGDLADARGDAAAAARDYLAAGDLGGVERHVRLLLGAKRVTGPDGALALETALVRSLAADGRQEDALAEASFELGRTEEIAAYALLVGSPERRAREEAALHAYARAVALAPFEERYLIAYGNQELNVDDVPAAERAFARARDADPASAEPLAGLGDAAFSRDDPATARAYLARARALDPASDAVHNLARELDE